MKQETKNLINWIKGVIANCPYLAMPDSIRADADEKKEDAINFLDSLPEIESKLCQGGYIQDKTENLAVMGIKYGLSLKIKLMKKIGRTDIQKLKPVNYVMT